MMNIEILNHVLVSGERNPMVEEATICVSFAGRKFFIKLEAHSLANMGRAMSDLKMEIQNNQVGSQIANGSMKYTFMQEYLHDQDLTWEVEHAPELETTE